MWKNRKREREEGKEARKEKKKIGKDIFFFVLGKDLQ